MCPVSAQSYFIPYEFYEIRCGYPVVVIESAQVNSIGEAWIRYEALIYVFELPPEK